MKLSARHLFPWVLLLLLLAGVPAGVLRSSFSAAPTPLEDRIASLETENADLRDELDRVSTELVQLSDDLTRASETAAEHVDVLERWPIPGALGFADEIVPLEIPAVYARVEDEWTRYLVNRHWLISWLRRSRDVFPTVEAKLAAAGLPEDLKYVVVVESGLRARAYSSAGAVGYWQFIRATGQRYGLKRNSWLDDRRNLESSTNAAIAYLSEMYEEFQSWPLVLSGFNAGERRVRTSIEEQGTANFYEMVLPSETEAYWFRAVVLKELLGHADRYDLHVPDDGWAVIDYDTVSVRVKQERLDLREITAATGMGYRELKALNPQYRRSWLPKGSHELVLPASVVEAFVAAFPSAKIIPSAPLEFVNPPNDQLKESSSALRP